MKIFKRLFGALALCIGLSILGWIIYAHFIKSPTVEHSHFPLSAILVSGSAIYVGAKWLFEKTNKNI
jgi:hypothetical protein